MRRRNATRQPAPEPTPTVDVAAAVAAELDRRRIERQVNADRAAYEAARCPTGCCRRCGVETCEVLAPDGSASPGWHADGDGHRCEICEQERAELPFTAGDGEWKETMARRLLDRTSIPMRAVAVADAFEKLRLWHFEHPGAPVATTREDRFAHVDLAALAVEYEQIANPQVITVPNFSKRERCPDCGTRDKWLEVDDSIPQLDGSVHHFKTWRCMACITRQPWGEAGRAAMT